jgi:Leucine-rich repeat (LRR) protein
LTLREDECRGHANAVQGSFRSKLTPRNGVRLDELALRHCSDLADDNLRFIGEMLEFSQARRITADGLAASGIDALPYLQELKLWLCKITNLNFLDPAMTTLRSLEVSECSLQTIRDVRLPPSLTSVNFSDNEDLVDDDLACIAGLPNLRIPNCDSTELTDAAFQHLARLAQLEGIDFRKWYKTKGTGLRHLRASAATMRKLDLRSSRKTHDRHRRHPCAAAFGTAGFLYQQPIRSSKNKEPEESQRCERCRARRSQL